MINHKKRFDDFITFIKRHKIVLLFALLTSLGGILIIGNVFSNFVYFAGHRYNISLSTSFSNIILSAKAFLYNNIIQGSAESFAIISKSISLYKTMGDVSILENINNYLNIFVFILAFVVFFVVNVSSYIIILLDIDVPFNKIVKKIKGSFLKLFLMEILKTTLITLVFSLIALVGYLFRINSTFYLITSFFLSFIVLYFIFYIYHFSIRALLLSNINIKESLFVSFSVLKNNSFSVLKNFILLILFIVLIILSVSLAILPLMFLNSYFVSIGYNIFKSINSVFIIIMNLFSFSLINLIIYKSINTIFLSATNLKK